MPIMNANYEVGGGLTPASIVNLIYPVGSIYMSVNNTSPATLFGGTWVKLENRFLIGASSSYTNGSTGGEATHTLSVDEMPSHTHTRGTMNITGSVDGHSTDDDGNQPAFQNGTGVFTTGTGGSTRMCRNNSWSAKTRLNFDASKNWTGETSSAGAGIAHNNMPPYLAVNMWKRTA